MNADRDDKSVSHVDRPLHWHSDRDIPRDEATRYFLATDAWRGLVRDDLPVQPPTNPRIAVLLTLPWPDIAHAARAASLFDLELRHLCLAYEAVRGEPESASGLFDFSDLDRWSTRAEQGELHRLLSAELDDPPRGQVDSLQTVGVKGPPLDLLLEPPERLQTLLCELPVSSLAFACSSFGQKMRLTRYSGSPLSGARYASAIEMMRVLLATREGTWSGPRDDLQVRHAELLGRPGLFRAVSPLRGASGFHATIYRGDLDGSADLVASIELLEARSSVEDYWKSLPADRWSAGAPSTASDSAPMLHE